MESLWSFCNSEVGITIIAGILVFILGKIFTAKPAWKVLYEKYKPLFMQGVKWAEKEIPDDTESAGKAKLDAALKYILIINEKLGKADKEALKMAITAVHTDAEGKGAL